MLKNIFFSYLELKKINNAVNTINDHGIPVYGNN